MTMGAARLSPTRKAVAAIMSKALDDVVDLLDLEQIELDIFRGRSPEGERRQRVFGGQVAGQALVAAGRTVPDGPARALAARLLHPAGRPGVPLVYLVERVRDGRSFTTRRVSAVQHGKTIFTLSASFHHAEQGVEHAEADAATCRRPEEVRADRRADWRSCSGTRPRELRPRQPDRHPARRAAGRRGRSATRRCAPTHSMVWLRADGELPDDPLLHVCLMTYASDMTLLDTVLLANGLSGPTAGPSARAWTTRCGSTGRSGPTGGCCTRRTRRSPAAPGPGPR